MCVAGEFIVQPPFDPSFTMEGGLVAYIIRKLPGFSLYNNPSKCMSDLSTTVLPACQQYSESRGMRRISCTAHADYTYGNDYDAQGQMKYGQGVSPFFHWDKRDFTYVYPPKNFPLPPAEVWLITALRPPFLCLACLVYKQFGSESIDYIC